MTILDFGFWILDCRRVRSAGGGRAPAHQRHPSSFILYPSSRSAQPSSRSAITLLEVLISIGVLTVGVLGAATLLPMAKYFQDETTKFDRGGALAQEAVHDLQIKNYLSPRRWIFIDPSNAPAAPFTPEGISQLTGTFAAPNASYTQFSAFAIDPLGFSYVFAAQNQPGVQFPSYFPAFTMAAAVPSAAPFPAGTAPTIYRAGITANDYWPLGATVPVTSPMVMTFPVADRMMRSNDDLLFALPPNTDYRPTANQFAASSQSSGTAQQMSGTYVPDYLGDFSWIATVSRTPSDMLQGPFVAASLHRFQVSVVVLQKRDLTLWAAGLTPEQPPSERQVYAMFTQYGGQALNGLSAPAPFFGGGGLQLYVYEGATANPGQPSRHWLDNIKPNTYLMLSANFITYTNSNFSTQGTPYPVLAWYRILNVDDGPNQDPNNNSRWYRNVNVAGSDWASLYFQWPQPSAGNPTPPLFQNWLGADPTAPGAIIPLNTNPNVNSTTPTMVPVAFCTLMDDSIAEYDDVIVLDNSLVRQ
jgi:hypothetical protein